MTFLKNVSNILEYIFAAAAMGVVASPFVRFFRKISDETSSKGIAVNCEDMIRRMPENEELNDESEKTESEQNETNQLGKKDICNPDPVVARRILHLAILTIVADILVWTTSLAFLYASWILVSEQQIQDSTTFSVNIFLHVFFKSAFILSIFFASVRSAKNQRRNISKHNLCAGTVISSHSVCIIAAFLCTVAASPVFVSIYCTALFWSVWILDIFLQKKKNNFR